MFEQTRSYLQNPLRATPSGVRAAMDELEAIEARLDDLHAVLVWAELHQRMIENYEPNQGVFDRLNDTFHYRLST